MRRKRAILFSLCLLVGVAAIPVGLTWREVRQERLDRALIAIIKSVPPPNEPATLVYNDEATCKTAWELLRQGADPNARDKQAAPPRSMWQVLRDSLQVQTRALTPGPTCLHLTLQTWEYHPAENRWNPGYTLYNRTRLAKLLLENGADSNAREDPFDPASDTPLLVASYNEQWEIARLLMEHGAKINLRGKFELPALLLAAHGNDTDMVRILAQHGADINVSEPGTGWTALWYAVSNDNPEMLQALLDARADCNTRGRNEETPLQYVHGLQKLHMQGQYSDNIVALLQAAGARE